MKNKRGQLFTILALLLIGLMFLSFEIFSTISERQTDKERVSSLDSFLFSLEQNLERQMYISGYRILFLAESEITSTGNYIDIYNFFNESFFNGSVNGKANDILIGATHDFLINSVNSKANKINAEVIMENSTIEINQTDPWNIKFSLITDFIIKDKSDLVRWEKQQIISTLIPIKNFEDPLYTINSLARVPNKMISTPYEGNYVNGEDISNLLDHVQNSYYSASSSAPSFLKRLEGDLSADPNGIESFVNLGEFSAQGLPIKTKSCIDYIYFSSNNPSYSSVAGMPNWFYIDDAHKTKYGL